MAIPTPDSLISIVKPTLDTAETFLTRLSAKMADAEVVKHAYRGLGGKFVFYVEGYLNSTGIINVQKALKEAGYEVHRIDQRVGYVPPAWWHDNQSIGYTDEGVTGTSQTPWFIVSVSKKKEEEQ